MKIVVIGVGNILFMDEGAGVYASKMLTENYTFEPEIKIIDGGTPGFKLMDYFQDCDKVIILDTLSIKDRPGSVYDLPAEALIGLGNYRQTAHEVEVVRMLEICSILDKTAAVNILGIIPEDIRKVRINLSRTLKKNIPMLVDKSILRLQDAGITVRPKPVQQNIDEIIAVYNQPVCPPAQ